VELWTYELKKIWIFLGGGSYDFFFIWCNPIIGHKLYYRKGVLVPLQIQVTMCFVSLICVRFILTPIWTSTCTTHSLSWFVSIDLILNSNFVGAFYCKAPTFIFLLGIKEHALDLHFVTNMKINKYFFLQYYLTNLKEVIDHNKLVKYSH